MRPLVSLFLLVPLAAQADPAELAAKIDALYVKRDEAAAAKEQDALITEALKAHPEDFGILWRAARWKFWASDGATDNRLKKQLGKEGWDLGDRAAKANPAGVEGHYFAAICMGNYSTAVGILKALGDGIEGKFNERLDKAIAIDGGTDRAGPHLAKGRYWWELPWPKRDLAKSKAELEIALKKNPENLRAHLYMAETLLKDGDAKKAKEHVTVALTGSTAYDPPEARRVQKLAKTVAEQIEEELK